MHVEISSLPGLAKAIKRCHPGYIISVTDPNSPESLQAKSILATAPCLYARLNFHDIDVPAPGYRMPSKDIIASVLVMIDRINPGERPLLIQCNAGISRSPAVALLAQCHVAMQDDSFTPGDARHLVRALDGAFGPISPNPAVMQIGEELLGNHGKAMREEAGLLDRTRLSIPVDSSSIF
ncbi:hypothetical protein [Pseudosulfitobacter pseudonitzschiae]|uniref:hypothetical protein n=1 Tax=Pseudosulfitobacter pseudonitzschiae TaxID=1402135 RepID=UPI003B78CAF4